VEKYIQDYGDVRERQTGDVIPLDFQGKNSMVYTD
jgi:hypothetical protein